MTLSGQFFDGESPRQHEVTVTVSQDLLIVQYLENDFRKEHSFRRSDLSPEPDGETVILTQDGKTLILTRAAWKMLGQKRTVDRKFLILSCVSLSFFISLALWHDSIIRKLTVLVPEKFMEGAAESVRSEYTKLNCLSPSQAHIMESVFLRLGKNKDEYTLYLIPSAIENAFAMPGNIIVFHDSILKKLDSIEAFAGVLAHEIAHIEEDHLKRKVVKGLVFQWASFAVLGNSGGAGLISGILEGKYNQSEEKEADTLAARILEQAKIDPRGVQKFFLSAGKKEDLLTKYLALSHPDYAERVRTFTPRLKAYRPMNKDDWRILKKGCQSSL